MAAANNLPEPHTLDEILALWRSRKFTGVAIFNVHLGTVQSVEFGRPDRIQIDHSELLGKSLLTEKENP